jgi:mRNA interferase MazF
MTSNPFSFGTIAVALFPFSDVKRAKPRPLVILAPTETLGANPRQHLCAMITSTSAHWDSDISITDIAHAGLKVPCHVRLKLFTLDERLIAKCIGTLSARDEKTLRKTLTGLFAT